MAKAPRSKRNGASGSSPYQKPASKQAPIFKFNTKIGQHILKNPAIADAIVAKANIQPTETVLEIGPGTGVLTMRILEHARSVIAVELDPRMAAEVSCRVQGTPLQRKLEVILGDFIKLSNDDLKPFDVCISNTPYQISSPLVFKLLSLPQPPRVSILMVQREFALRLVARPGDSLYSRLSVNAQFFSKVSHVMKVSKKNFTPPPQVESSVVRIEPRTDKPNISWDEWDGMLRVCFMRKNKTMNATWTGNKVRAMVEQNWITWASINAGAVPERDWKILRGEEVVPDAPMDDDDADMDGAEEDEGMDMDVDAGGDEDSPRLNVKVPRNKGGTITLGATQVPRLAIANLVLAKIRRVLSVTEMAGQRASKLDETDFLRLLSAFNDEGLHFA
ncbi:probable dimethyladenosine transferase [Cephalotrichum gorgonifer]|uniref:rRNA adenine N(6)-methyltransferase n=1 Tax=Cephalotrichum gorgonifer TaxID=2041049 RepID=A0AAE8N2E1_9PEZI|nr:probable dimethyladenosine transferase [Cephalotrichum gorgonifer]